MVEQKTPRPKLRKELIDSSKEYQNNFYDKVQNLPEQEIAHAQTKITDMADLKENLIT